MMIRRDDGFHIPYASFDANPRKPQFGKRFPHLRMKNLAWWLCAGLLASLVAWDFAVATTFLGDDYIFRAFARLEPSPLLAFVADKHGGEYYRPIPMLLWWVIERSSGGGVWA